MAQDETVHIAVGNFSGAGLQRLIDDAKKHGGSQAPGTAICTLSSFHLEQIRRKSIRLETTSNLKHAELVQTEQPVNLLLRNCILSALEKLVRGNYHHYIFIFLSSFRGTWNDN
jgi:hypothetical protein